MECVFPICSKPMVVSSMAVDCERKICQDALRLCGYNGYVSMCTYINMYISISVYIYI